MINLGGKNDELNLFIVVNVHFHKLQKVVVKQKNWLGLIAPQKCWLKMLSMMFLSMYVRIIEMPIMILLLLYYYYNNIIIILSLYAVIIMITVKHVNNVMSLQRNFNLWDYL